MKKTKRYHHNEDGRRLFYLRTGILLTVILFLSFAVHAQQTLRGLVTDSLGKPLAGVTVSLRSASLATQTNEGGRFVLNVPAICLAMPV